MTSLAWTLKATSALFPPIASPRISRRGPHTGPCLEFKTFVQEIRKVPCLIVRRGRRVIGKWACVLCVLLVFGLEAVAIL